MPEVKFISHITRNTYSAIVAYLLLTLVADFSVSWSQVAVVVLVFTLGYVPVYFLNDLCDHQDDLANGKANLYNAIKNQMLFYMLWGVFMTFGLVGSWVFAKEAFVILAVLYGQNALYSLPPFKVRNRPVFRELLIASIYTLKWLWLIVALHFPYSQIPWLLIGTVACYAAVVVAMYKKYKQPLPMLEYVWSGLLLITWLLTVARYPKTFLLIAPMLLALTYYHSFYKNEQKGYNKHQIAYFLYALVVYGIIQLGPRL